MGGAGSTYRLMLTIIWVRKFEGRDGLGRHRHRWGNTKLDLMEVVFECKYWIQDEQWTNVDMLWHSTEPSGSTEGREVLE
jgi:hypothetical protein